MITVLLTLPHIETGYLDVTIRLRTDPYIRPCRWNYELPDTFQVIFIFHRLSLVLVCEAVSFLYTCNAFRIYIYIQEVNYFCRFLVVAVEAQKFFMRQIEGRCLR